MEVITQQRHSVWSRGWVLSSCLICRFHPLHHLLTSLSINGSFLSERKHPQLSWFLSTPSTPHSPTAQFSLLAVATVLTAIACHTLYSLTSALTIPLKLLLVIIAHLQTHGTFFSPCHRVMQSPYENGSHQHLVFLQCGKLLALGNSPKCVAPQGLAQHLFISQPFPPRCWWFHVSSPAGHSLLRLLKHIWVAHWTWQPYYLKSNSKSTYSKLITFPSCKPFPISSLIT